MEAYVYLRVSPGKVPAVAATLSTMQSVRSAAAVVGPWDVLALIDGPDLASIAQVVLSQLHQMDGVTRTVTAPVVPADRIGVGGFGALTAPPVVANACYVHVKATPGAAASIAERLAESEDVAGVAVIAGEYDLIACVRQPWETASGLIVELIHGLPGVVGTNTLVALDYEEPEEDRDQFSAWN